MSEVPLYMSLRRGGSASAARYASISLFVSQFVTKGRDGHARSLSRCLPTPVPLSRSLAFHRPPPLALCLPSSRARSAAGGLRPTRGLPPYSSIFQISYPVSFVSRPLVHTRHPARLLRGGEPQTLRPTRSTLSHTPGTLFRVQCSGFLVSSFGLKT